MKKSLTEGEDYYFNENGLMVLTQKYHIERGFCCGNGCKHCPYDWINVAEPLRSRLKVCIKTAEQNEEQPNL